MITAIGRKLRLVQLIQSPMQFQASDGHYFFTLLEKSVIRISMKRLYHTSRLKKALLVHIRPYLTCLLKKQQGFLR